MGNETNRAIADLLDELAAGLQGGALGPKVRVGITLPGSEHGEEELLRAALLAQAQLPAAEITVIGSLSAPGLRAVEAASLKEAHARMEELLQAGELDAAVTLHYSFPIGVATIGRVVTPALGRSMYIASTTGASSAHRVSAMVRNAVSAQAVAQACGCAEPTLGILNVDGAQQVLRALQRLQAGGYPLRFAQSAREDGGAIMRGNDLLQGVPDIMLVDSLTGNLLVKTLSAFATGGSYEAVGDGYGPGAGSGQGRTVLIISRASGAPVVAGALKYAAACALGKLPQKVQAHYALAEKAGLSAILAELEQPPAAAQQVTAPPATVVNEEITGVDVLAIEDAVHALWRRGLYATGGMGCTGPVVMVASENAEAALAILREEKYL
ncbi:MAG: glycine reductase [Christensenellaceae bacterium]|jgi:hypothetical protein|nr:glycine reductase [Christensenellaceae bacterium]